MTRKWENCLTLDRQSWGNRRNMTVGSLEDRHPKRMIMQKIRHDENENVKLHLYQTPLKK